MLVLARKQGEAIKIGENITLTVIEIAGGRVRLGIDAPRDVGVYRSEVYSAIANALENEVSEGSCEEPVNQH